MATTNSPKVAAISITYDVVGLKDDGTPLFGYTLVISRNREDYTGIERSAEQILSNLYTSFAKGTFLAFNYREGQTQVNTLVKMGPPQVVQVPTSPSDSGPATEVGDIVLLLQERI